MEWSDGLVVDGANGAKLDVLGQCQKKDDALNTKNVCCEFDVLVVGLEFWWQFDAVVDDLRRLALC